MQEKIQLGNHVCSIYQNKEQQFSQLISFFKNGLDNNHKCMYIVDENTGEEIISEFEKAGLEIRKNIDSGQFVILTKKETYLKEGSFSPDRMIELFKKAEANSLRDGYSGVRATGEMTWVLENISDSKKLIEYETNLNNFFPNSNSAAICQYNEDKFEPELLMDVVRTHPYLIIHGGFYENKYFYNLPEHLVKAKGIFAPASYKTMIEIIMDD